MYTIVLTGLLAFALAAPRHSFEDDFEDFFKGEIFDVRRFWREFRRDMSKLENVYKRFRGSTCSEGIDGNEYKVSMILRGYDEDDITVKAKQGLLIVQAVKNGPNAGKNYLDVRSLPDFVKELGSWTYEKGMLTIVFPIKGEVPSATNDEDTKTDDSDESLEIDVREKPTKPRNKSLNQHTVDSGEDELIPARY